VAVFRNDGTASFVLDSILNTSQLPFKVVLSDLDGDGKRDMAIAHHGGIVSIRLNDGFMEFPLHSELSAGGDYPSIAADDLDQDGDPDLVVTNYHDDDISVLLNLCDAAPQNNPPIAVCKNATVQLDAMGQGSLVAADVDGGSYDPEGGPIDLAIDRDTFTCDDVGPQTVILTVTDDGDLPDTCEATVTVVDSILPEVSVTPSDTCLWPPNHEYVDVYLDASVDDDCSVNTVQIVVTSNEADDANGGGDGKTTADILILDADGVEKASSIECGTAAATATTSYVTGDWLRLRAERLGSGDGRDYTITITATDASNNQTVTSVAVHVPHDWASHLVFCTDPDCTGE